MKNKWFKTIFIILFLMFLGLYISANAGLIDYQAKYKNMMTEKEIEKFEEDIKNNVNIDIKDYIKTDNKVYSNNVSKTTYKISKTIGNVIKDTLNLIFNSVDKAINS